MLNDKELARARELVHRVGAAAVYVPGIMVLYYSNKHSTQRMVLQYSDKLTGINGYGIKIAEPENVSDSVANVYTADYLPDLSDAVTRRILGLNDDLQFVAAYTERAPERARPWCPSAIEAYEIKIRSSGEGTGNPVSYERYAIVTTAALRDQAIKENTYLTWNPITVVPYDMGFVAVDSKNFVPCLDQPLAGYEAKARKEALAKLTPYDRRLLRIPDDA